MTPRPLIIAGMPRSGTTLLWHLCRGHPQIRLMLEFGNYAQVGDPLADYAKWTAGRVQEIHGRWRIRGPRVSTHGSFARRLFRQGRNHASNVGAAGAHLLRVSRFGSGAVTLHAVVHASGDDRRTRIVGDKLPQYIFRMPRLAALSDLLRLVIYRDGRDVTSSYLGRARGDWQGRPWVRQRDTAEKVAVRWVEAIELMERFSDSLFLVRYEDLVADPRTELSRLAEWLDVDGAGFDATLVSRSSVGKHRSGLTAEELDEVDRVAGPTLRRLGYGADR